MYAPIVVLLTVALACTSAQAKTVHQDHSHNGVNYTFTDHPHRGLATTHSSQHRLLKEATKPMNLPRKQLLAKTQRGRELASDTTILQRGGPIMANTVNVYMIYVGGYSYRDSVPATLNYFVSRLGGSDWWRTNTRYYDSSAYANGQLTFAGDYYIDTIADMNLPNGGTSKDIAATIEAAINWGIVPSDDFDNSIYVVVSKSGVYQLVDCDQEAYCGWHTWAGVPSGSKMKYTFIPEGGCNGRCSPSDGSGNSLYSDQTSPTGSRYLDGLVSVVAHELTETVTDPELNAWRDPKGDENGDLCAWKFGSAVAYTFNDGSVVVYNVLTADNTPFMIQLNYDPSLDPSTGNTQQYGCVYGVDSSGQTVTSL